MFENCTEIRSFFSSYLDDVCEPQQLKSIRFHLEDCRACRVELDHLQTIQSDIRSLPRQRIPSELALQMRVRLSQDLHADWVSRLQVRMDNALRPVLLPATGGILTAVIFFGLIFGTNFVPPRGLPDVPTALATPPRLRELPPLNFNTDDDQLVLLTQVDAAGRVMSYEVISGHISPELRHKLDRVMYFSVFDPATTFGMPTDGKVLLSLSRITVRG